MLNKYVLVGKYVFIMLLDSDSKIDLGEWMSLHWYYMWLLLSNQSRRASAGKWCEPLPTWPPGVQCTALCSTKRTQTHSGDGKTQ